MGLNPTGSPQPRLRQVGQQIWAAPPLSARFFPLFFPPPGEKAGPPPGGARGDSGLTDTIAGRAFETPDGQRAPFSVKLSGSGSGGVGAWYAGTRKTS